MSWNIFITLALHEYISSTHLIRNGYSTAITEVVLGPVLVLHSSWLRLRNFLDWSMASLEPFVINITLRETSLLPRNSRSKTSLKPLPNCLLLFALVGTRPLSLLYVYRPWRCQNSPEATWKFIAFVNSWPSPLIFKHKHQILDSVSQAAMPERLEGIRHRLFFWTVKCLYYFYENH